MFCVPPGHSRTLSRAVPLLLLALLGQGCDPRPPGPTPIPSPTLEPSLLPGVSPTPEPTATPGPDRAYQATLRRTSHGVVHVLADDLGSVAFGQGYAFAEYHTCVLADMITKVRSERSQYFGPGPEEAHLDSDFAFLHLGILKEAEDTLPRLPADVQEVIRGYVAGYNRHLSDVGIDALPVECRGAPWVHRLRPEDLLAYYLGLSMLSSSQALIPGIARALPPGDSVETLKPLPANSMRELEIGSNAIALGRDKTASGQGMLLANPHFMWEGELKFFESQLTVPGLLNVYGVSLMGVVGVLIGFNEQVAWSHTVSHAARGSFYQLALDAENPTVYTYDGAPVSMTSSTYTILVKQEDGQQVALNRTLWRSQYGPMVATEELGWTRATAITWRDANVHNERIIEQWLHMDLAEDLDRFVQVHEEVDSIPWVYTVAVDAGGEAFFADGSSVPYLSDASLSEWQAALEHDVLTQVAWELGAPLLDGSKPQNAWVEASGAVRSGLVPFELAPKLFRADYVANGNDSHWLTHHEDRLEGFSPMFGPERTGRTPRTRMNLHTLLEEGPQAAAGEDLKFTRDELKAALMSNRSLTSDLLLQAVIQRCSGIDTVILEGRPQDISGALSALRAFDGRFDASSVGAAVWREFLVYFELADFEDAGLLFGEPFSLDDPVGTPRGISPAPAFQDDPIFQALATAARTLERSGFPLDAPLSALQKTYKAQVVLPISGGQAREGTINVANYSQGPVLNSSLMPETLPTTFYSAVSHLSELGYPVNYGTSFVMALEFTPQGPQADALLTYSQSDDQDSPYFTDQTELFSRGAWRPVRFSEADIQADPELLVYSVEAQPTR